MSCAGLCPPKCYGFDLEGKKQKQLSFFLFVALRKDPRDRIVIISLKDRTSVMSFAVKQLLHCFT